jgi:hypothetical protein
VVGRPADNESGTMATENRVTQRWQRQMAAAFFSTDPDGILVYEDPLLGQLKNQRGIEIRVDAAAGRLNVVVHGRIVRSFSLLGGDAGEACLAAAGEYFRLVQESAPPLARVA